MSIDIQIWSDVACPWCFIGKRRFERAVAGFADPVTVTWRSFQLDPTLPEHSELSEVDYLVQSKQLPRPAVVEMMAEVTRQGRAEGVRFDFDRLVVANSRRALRLLQAAKRADAADGGRRTTALQEALLSAHFEHGADTGAAEVLVSHAVAAGLDADTAAAALDSPDLEQAVSDDIAAAARIGVRGVPFFVFENKYALSGAQPAEVFTQVLDTIVSEQKASGLISVPGDPGASCGPAGCN